MSGNEMFTEKQRETLAKELPEDMPDVKRDGDGHSYLPAHVIKARLNAVFGFGMWSTAYVAPPAVVCHDVVPGKNGDNNRVVMSCCRRLTVQDGDGNTCSHEETGFHVAHAPVRLQPPFELAAKGCSSDALKRCASHFGTKFGLSLYDEDDPLGRTAAQMAKTGGEFLRSPAQAKAELSDAAAAHRVGSDGGLPFGRWIWRVVEEVTGKTKRDEVAGEITTDDYDNVRAVLPEFCPLTGDRIPDNIGE